MTLRTSKLQQNNELLCAYLEPLAAARRIVVVGAQAAAVGEGLLDLGARSVTAYQTANAAPGRPASARIPVRPLSRGGIEARDGAFDLAVVPDASDLDEAESVLAELRRLVGDDGVIVVGAGAAGPGEETALGYYELYDLVALQFDNVTMVGQVPFAGAALAVLGEEGEPEVTVDTQLAGDAEPPQRFFAVGSQSTIDVRPYVILQVAQEEAEEEDEAESEPATIPPRVSEAADRDRSEMVHSRLRAEVLESQLEEHRGRVVEANEIVRRLENELLRRGERMAELEEAAISAAEAARVAVTALADARNTASSYGEIERAHSEDRARMLLLGAELDEALARSRELEALAVKSEQTSMAAAALEAELLEMSEAHAAEVAGLEEALRERGRAVIMLEREVARRERIVQELLLTLEAHPNEAASAPALHAQPSAASDTDRESFAEERSKLHEKLQSLAQDAARREGELLAARWRIEELELAATHEDKAHEPAAPVPSAESGSEGDEHAKLRDEIEMLRQALRQEHEARLLADAEVQRHITLLKQAEQAAQANQTARLTP